MCEILSASSSDWMQLYQQTVDTSFAPNTSFVAAGDHHLAPKGCVSKPIRRRSRASKTTPITLFNTDAKNFISLVQQFTGCRRRSSSISFVNNITRSPVNINFALTNAKNDHHYNHSPTSDHPPILSQPFVDTKHEQHYQHQQQLSNEEQEQEGEISFDSITSTDHDDLFPQGFVMDDVFFLA
ncbi:VQ motif-containing protein 22-like [Hibiscus syriacus]|uniref:VQ motif-containing protein 22-like n=1 Tax=Hibiscus syriacus TaxID=106335 RepID=UPI001921448F|nr:VQ motif-containing protein 22-like [Hibiscus syriacus]